MFGEGKVLVLMEALLHQRKGLALLLVNQIQNFPWPCIIVVIIVICMFKEKKSIILKQMTKILTLQTQFCLGSISNKFGAIENMHNF